MTAMNRIDWLSEARAIEDDIIQIRRRIHAHPEIGNQEHRTAELIESCLLEWGIEARRVVGTGIVGILRGQKTASADPANSGNAASAGGPGRVVAFRADMDALPVSEETGLDYASTCSGMMHACGHDIHTAALLGAARLLASHVSDLEGTYVFLFQPDEEGDGGAERILAEGVLQQLGVEAIFGAHCDPKLPAGSIGVKHGRFYAAAGKFDVTVRGLGTHGAEPEKGTDSLYAAARMSVALKELTEGDGDDRAVVTVGMLSAGTARNIISDHADFSGILRTAGADRREEKKRQIEEAVYRIARECKVTADYQMVDGYVGVTNHESETAHVEQVGRELLGDDQVIAIEKPLMTTEDFGFYQERFPGSFFHIGVGSEYPLHSPKFCPNESSIAVAAAMEAALMAAY